MMLAPERRVLRLECTIEDPDFEVIGNDRKSHNPRELYLSYTGNQLTKIEFIPRSSKFIDLVELFVPYVVHDNNDYTKITSFNIRAQFSVGREDREDLAKEWIKLAERAIGRLTTENHITKVKYMGWLEETHDVERLKPSPKKKK